MQCINHAPEFNEKSIASCLDDPAMMVGDLRVD
jgi:hypothetical protein